LNRFIPSGTSSTEGLHSSNDVDGRTLHTHCCASPVVAPGSVGVGIRCVCPRVDHENRKGSLSLAICWHERHRQMIKGRSHVEQEIPDHYRHIGVRGQRCPQAILSAASTLWVLCDLETVSLPERLDPLKDVNQVFLSALELQPPRRIGRHRTSVSRVHTRRGALAVHILDRHDNSRPGNRQRARGS